MKKLKLFFIGIYSLLVLHLTANIAFVATGCSYPTSLDAFVNKSTGDFFTIADVNKMACAIEQAQARINEFIGGKSGGQTYVGDTASAGFIGFTSTSHATKGTIRFGAESVFNEASNLLGIGTTSPLYSLHAIRATPELVAFTSSASGAVGPTMTFNHASTTPAASDITASIFFSANDSSIISRTIGAIQMVWEDTNAASMDSQMQFSVQSNVSAGNTNTTATLSSLGVWTDASTAKNKEYEGDVHDVLARLKQLKTLGVYRGKNVPQDKLAAAERHYSPTAEEFWQVFRLGKENSGGIAPKDVSWLAVKAIMELEARVAQLEKGK